MSTSPDVGPVQVSVLIVDDDPWTTKAISLALRGESGIGDIIEVHGGAEAVATYQTSQPDVVLMDLNMPPGMSGVTAIEQIRRGDPTARIVVLTTVAPGPGLARALYAGAVAVVRKTASQADLRTIVLATARGEDPIALRYLARDIVISGDQMPGAPAVPPRLTPAEREVLQLIADGCGYNEIADRQGITVWTARSHVKHLREKLHAENLAQLVLRALQYRYISV